MAIGGTATMDVRTTAAGLGVRTTAAGMVISVV
jgi:hypothetical protein